jgi:hypothetical protein
MALTTPGTNGAPAPFNIKIPGVHVAPGFVHH